MSSTVTDARISVSTWSLHRLLGDPTMYGPEHGHQIPAETHNRGSLSLLDVPAAIKAHDINTLEICHFHLPSLDEGYLRELRSQLVAEEIEFFSLLVDNGDITHPEHAERDQAWIAGWIPIAAQLGARCMRVIAGKAAPTPETLEQSYRRLKQLSEQAQAYGVRLMTENWFGLLSRPEDVVTLLDRLEGKVGLCMDFGNWGGPTKYADLAPLARYANSCHAKADFAPEYQVDEQDYRRCLKMTQDADFAGPYTLIYAGPGNDEWQGLAVEHAIVSAYI